MAKFEIELDDKGDFLGAVPGELSAVLDRIKTTAHGEGFGKGNQKAVEEAKAQIAGAVAAEKARLDASLPLERAKWADIEAQNTHIKTELDATRQQNRKAQTEREETHALEITRRVELENKLVSKIRGLVNENLRALAAEAGARKESLTELEVILQNRIDYTDPANPFVKGEDGQPAKTTAGLPLSMDVFVKQYLDNHPHHRKPAAGQGGGARGGASLHGHNASTSSVEAASARIDGGDRSLAAIHELVQANRERAKRAS